MEEVQKFYSDSITDETSPNATAIAKVYHTVVSDSPLSFYFLFLLVMSFTSPALYAVLITMVMFFIDMVMWYSSLW